MKKIFHLNNQMTLMILMKIKRKNIFYSQSTFLYRFSIRNQPVKKAEFK